MMPLVCKAWPSQAEQGRAGIGSTKLVKRLPVLHILVSRQLSNSFSKIYPKEIITRVNKDLITKSVHCNIVIIMKN